MAQPTFGDDIIILKKTKLGESDLIVTYLCKDGSLSKAVAKGARKPRNSLSSRLEIFNCAHVLFSKSKGLDIVTESKLNRSFKKLQTDPLYASAAACISQALLFVAQEGLEVPHLFDMTLTALSALERSDEKMLPVMVSAYLMKLSALLGNRASFDRCAVCGKSDIVQTESGKYVRFSVQDGGLICKDCASMSSCMNVLSAVIAWEELLFQSTFEEILSFDIASAPVWELLDIANSWMLEHFGVRLKAIKDLITYSAL